MSSPRALRVAIASDQPIFLRGLGYLLLHMPDVQLIGAAACWSEVWQLCQLAQPDAVVIDVHNALEEYGEVVRQVRADWPALRIVLLLEDGSATPANWEEANLFCFPRDLGEAEFGAALGEVRRDEHRSARPPSAPAEAVVPVEREAVHAERDDPMLAHERELVNRELAMAGKIQADLLPEEAPLIRGWDLSAVLLPARETSGDFYDFIPLGPRKWGMVVADVSDKGMGAALLMALTSTLFRTFAVHFPTLPAFTLQSVSERILSDTRGGMFVTAFLGVLEPHTGRLVYANAGHPPGYLIGTRRGRETIERLRPTGMAMGVDEQSRWRQKDLRMEIGDLLVLYTDGITEAQNSQGDFFGEERLLEEVLARKNCSAGEIQTELVRAVHRFAGNAQDDIAVIVMRREA